MNKYYLYNEKLNDLITLDDPVGIPIFELEGYEETTEIFAKKILQKETDMNKITELREMLHKTDWKVIVNAELIQAGLEPKYLNLHLERQSWRNQINEIEEFWKTNKIKDEA